MFDMVKGLYHQNKISSNLIRQLVMIEMTACWDMNIQYLSLFKMANMQDKSTSMFFNSFQFKW